MCSKRKQDEGDRITKKEQSTIVSIKHSYKRTFSVVLCVYIHNTEIKNFRKKTSHNFKLEAALGYLYLAWIKSA